MDDRSRAIEHVLAGDWSYDLLDESEQVAVRAEWANRAAHLRAGLSLAAEFDATGQGYSETDEDGNLLIVNDDRQP